MGDTIAIRDNKVVIDDNKVSTGCAEGCGICVDCTIVECYRVKDYTADMFGASGCTMAGCFGVAWDGTFQYRPDYAVCGWRRYNNVNQSICIGNSNDITGTIILYKTCALTNGDAGVVSWMGDLSGYWMIGIRNGQGNNAFWVGAKSDGVNPVGVYTKTKGCTTGPDTLEIEACPGAAHVTVPTSYRIAGYSVGDIGCVACLANTWDGTFPGGEDFCAWETNVDGGVVGQVGFNAVDLRWELILGCTGVSGGGGVWTGYKTTGGTPAGTYSRVSGCDLTSSLTVEETP